jgi:protein SCO1
MKKAWIYIGFFALLLTGFYFAISSEHPFTDAKLVVINSIIPEFSFTDQNNKTLTNRSLEGKVYVAEYFFTTCKGICPKMNANMRRVFEAYKDEPDFAIVSHTCMPEVDSVPVMKAYEQKMLAGKLIRKNDGSYTISSAPLNSIPENKNWFFVTGAKSDLYKLARQGYMIDNGKPDSTQRVEDQFIHTQFFSLVDRYGRVRGIYDGLIEDEVQKLLKDIPALMKEKVDPKRFMNGFGNNPG